MFDLGTITMTGTELTTAERSKAIGQMANHHAAANAFSDYNSRKSDNTLRSHKRSLAAFAEFLATVGEFYDADALQSDPVAWKDITFGLVAAFRNSLVQQGYAIASVNARLSGVKIYAKMALNALAAQATDGERRAAFTTEAALVATVVGYTGKDGKKIDERREVTRIGHKKDAHTPLTAIQVAELKVQPLTPQGRRDAVLMAILLDHGLRASEVAGLQVTDIKLADNSMTFYRTKVNMVQTHTLSHSTRQALKAYFEAGDVPAAGPLLRASLKSGELTHAGMTVGNVSQRARKLGEDIGIDRLSAHDCRHYWATYWAKRVDKLPKGLFSLQEAGGWSSLAMPRRYVENAAIANDGME